MREPVQDAEVSTLAARMQSDGAGYSYVSFPPLADNNPRSGCGDRGANGASSQPQIRNVGGVGRVPSNRKRADRTELEP